MRCWLLIVLGACGSTPPPKTAEPAKPKPAAAKATCGDAGVILRGELATGDDDAGRAREQAIERACVEDTWSQATIDCVASIAHPQDCLDTLSDAQRSAYEQSLAAWEAEYGGGDHVTGMQLLGCDDVVSDVSHFPPLIDATSPERAWHVLARKELLHEECDHDWSEAMKTCIANALDETSAIAACMAQELAPDEQKALADELDELATLAAKIAAAKQKPKTITCPALVKTHYADARWKGKLDGFKPAERKKIIAASRDAMTKACTADGWDDTTRACIVVGGGQRCHARDRLRWGFPATGTVTKVGIAECDDYAAAVAKLTSCNLLSQAARDQILRSQQQMLTEIARVPAAERAKMATSCKAAMETIASSTTNAGC